MLVEVFFGSLPGCCGHSTQDALSSSFVFSLLLAIILSIRMKETWELIILVPLVGYFVAHSWEDIDQQHIIIVCNKGLDIVVQLFRLTVIPRELLPGTGTKVHRKTTPE